VIGDWRLEISGVVMACSRGYFAKVCSGYAKSSCRQFGVRVFYRLVSWDAMHYTWRRPEGDQEESRRKHGGGLGVLLS
jgi:hypothetical protein